VRDELALGYASTVHKAQGSEFDRVALVLPDEDMPLLTRELVYTAVTRSRRAVVVVGSASLLASALERRVVRTSGFGDSLAAWAASASRSSSSSR
jgi:exodeoxyribonuclease V alpha subunit